MSCFGSRFLLEKPAGCKVAGCAHPHPFAQVHRLPRSESQTVLRHLHCSVRLTQVELSVALVTVHSCHKAS